MEEHDDARLVQLSLDGDMPAFQSLISKYRLGTTRLIQYLIEDRHDTEDIYQEVLIVAWQRLGSLTAPEKFRQWLLQIARNRCMDYHRQKRSAAKPMDSEVFESLANRYGRRSQSKVREIELRDALKKITAIEREAVDLFYLKGFSITEMTELLGCPDGTVKRRLHSARGRLRRILEEDDR